MILFLQDTEEFLIDIGSVRRERNSFGVPFYQRDIQLFFKFLNSFGDGLLGNQQFLCGLAEAPLLTGGNVKFNLAESRNLSPPCRRYVTTFLL